jgi:hypothetical protein
MLGADFGLALATAGFLAAWATWFTVQLARTIRSDDDRMLRFSKRTAVIAIAVLWLTACGGMAVYLLA